MVNIRGLLKEVKLECFKNILLDTFLRTVILFFIIDILRSIIDISYVFSYGVSAIYFIVKILKEMKKISVKNFQKENQEIHEMLSTAADNINRDNIVTQGLFEDVINKAKNLSSGTLIVPKNILLTVLLIPILAIASFEIAPVRLDVVAESDIVQNLNFDFFQELFNRTEKKDAELIDDVLKEIDIYGERSIVVLGNQEINIEMQLNFQTDLTRPSRDDTSKSGFNDFPDRDESFDPELFNEGGSSGEAIQETDLAMRWNEKIRNLR